MLAHQGQQSGVGRSGRQAALRCLQGTFMPCLPGSPGMPLSPWKQSKKHRKRATDTTWWDFLGGLALPCWHGSVTLSGNPLPTPQKTSLSSERGVPRGTSLPFNSTTKAKGSLAIQHCEPSEEPNKGMRTATKQGQKQNKTSPSSLYFCCSCGLRLLVQSARGTHPVLL